MAIRHPLAVMLGYAGQVMPSAASVLAQPAGVGAYSLTPGRLWAMTAIALGLAGVAVGGLALRSAGRVRIGNARVGAFGALAAGLVGTVIGGLVVAAAEGGPGTGYGIVGGYFALVVGPAAMVVGTLALTRSRRTG